ncbi:MAG: peptide chain release factor N(5)-glutamine methyltransferase [Eubacterium sp.]|nr:peptide chain release factor N(5)-glutamine methyltransferase [Eubacterium sp.]
MTHWEAYQLGKKQLMAAGIADYDMDSHLLVEYATGQFNRFDLEKRMTKEQESVFLEALSQRKKRIPLQHITGTAWFYGFRFLAREGVLIPRFDTECLVEKALKTVPDRNIRFLDLCTGSGCIGISFWLLRRERHYSDTGILSDISPLALSLAEDNVKALSEMKEEIGDYAGELRDHVEVVASDLFEALNGQQFDLIMSNPPYIPATGMDELMPEVRDHDPRLALTDEGDGLSFYRRIAAEAKNCLKSDGYLILEIGYDQGETVPEILKREGFGTVSVSGDLAGLDRVVTARR